MEYVYAALLLHKLKQDINEDNVKNVIKATGVAPDDVRVKSLVAAISEVNIEDALKAAPIAAAPSAAAAAATRIVKCRSCCRQRRGEKRGEKGRRSLGRSVFTVRLIFSILLYCLLIYLNLSPKLNIFSNFSFLYF